MAQLDIVVRLENCKNYRVVIGDAPALRKEEDAPALREERDAPPLREEKDALNQNRKEDDREDAPPLREEGDVVE